MRFVGIGSPKQLLFDEVYYVPDACRYVIQVEDLCGLTEKTIFHPPLGKWLIAFGMQALGPTRYGWRLAPALAGIVTILLVYLLARRLTGSTSVAVLSAGLLSVDPLHFVHSRIAVLDIFVAMFEVAAFVCLVYDRDDDTRSFLRPWRAAAGVALGAAIASKLSGLFMLPVIVGIALLYDRRRGSAKLQTSLVNVAIWLVVVPALVYVATFVGRLEGELSVAGVSWIGALVERHETMLTYHRELRGSGIFPPHVLSSPAWSWLLLKRPMYYFFTTSPVGYREVLAVGNPAVWFLAIPGVAYLAYRAVRAKDEAAAIITAGFLAGYLPWFVLTFGADPYLFYMVPVVPFLSIAVAYCATLLWNRRELRIPLCIWGLAVVTGFIFLYPVLTGRPLTPEAWRARMLYRDCVSVAGERVERPLLPTQTGHGTWCWI